MSNSSTSGFLSNLGLEFVQIPINVLLTCIIAVLVYLIMKSWRTETRTPTPEPQLSKMKKRDFTVADLRKYDGKQEDGRVLVAVNGNVFDVTKGKRFYGPGGPYAAFGGKDASRGLATFSVSASGDAYDDLSDLNTMEMESVREWEAQFKEKYDLVGKLLKPGEEPRNYSDEEDEITQSSTGDRSKED